MNCEVDYEKTEESYERRLFIEEILCMCGILIISINRYLKYRISIF